MRESKDQTLEVTGQEEEEKSIFGEYLNFREAKSKVEILEQLLDLHAFTSGELPLD